MHLVINSIEMYSELDCKRIRNGIEKIETEAWLDLYFSASEEVRKKLGIKIIPVEYSFAAIASSVDIIAFNRIIGLGLSKPFSRESVKELKDELVKNKVKRFFIQLHPDAQPDDSIEILEENGFHFFNNWIKLYRGNAPLHVDAPALDIREIDKNNAEVFSKILLQNFGWTNELLPWIAGTVGRKNWKHYLGFDGDTPVATATLYVKGNYARFCFASTLPEYRGKGFQSALLARRIEDCRKLGVKEMSLETADDKPGMPSISKKNAIRAGFEIAYIRPNFLFKGIEG